MSLDTPNSSSLNSVTLTKNELWRIAQNECNTVLEGDPHMEALGDEIYDLRGSELIKTLLGESGVGKEGLARLVHRVSPRRSGKFVPVNAANLRGDLLESEFFGHKRGAFTGSTENKLGAFRTANGGSIFLDEVGDMSEQGQATALRALSGERKAKGVGEDIEYDIDSNIICATNKGLGHLRSDFRSRISASILYVPPLRERNPDHVRRVIQHIAHRQKTGQYIVADDAAQYLADELNGHEGNGRWLEDRIMAASEYARGKHETVITQKEASRSVENFRKGMLYGTPKTEHHVTRTVAPDVLELDFDSIRHPEGMLKGATQQMEERLVRYVLQQTNSNQTQAAQMLGVSRGWLRERILAYKINLETSVD